jgi:hypothetical protein
MVGLADLALVCRSVLTAGKPREEIIEPFLGSASHLPDLDVSKAQASHTVHGPTMDRGKVDLPFSAAGKPIGDLGERDELFRISSI